MLRLCVIQIYFLGFSIKNLGKINKLVLITSICQINSYYQKFLKDFQTLTLQLSKYLSNWF